MIKVKSLRIYPVKGMSGTDVSSAKTLERGFEHDRRYMLIDEDGTFVSQRTHPKLALFSPQIKNNILRVNFERKSLSINMFATSLIKVSTTIFDNVVPATIVSEESNAWFSTILGQSVRLVKMEASDVRYKNLSKGPDKVEVSFADGYPYLIAGTESLNQLNSKLENAITFDRFRPNIILETSKPHIEDSWENISIGKAQFLVVKPCARCQVITVDQNSGIISKEPLKTLSSYRKIDHKIFFGANAICQNVSEVHIGDEVEIL